MSYAEAGEVGVFNLGELLLRFPLANRLELRIAPNSYTLVDVPGADGPEGLQDISVGAKATLAEGAAAFDLLRPALAVLVNTTLPTGDDALGADGLQPQALLAAGWPLGGGAGLGADINVTSLDLGDDRVTQLAGGATLSYSLGETLGSYVELYRFSLNDGPDASYFDAGFTLLLSPDLQLDLSGGVGLNDNADDFFVGFGASRRW